MANDSIREFYFYFKYLWSPEDFENMQDWLQDEFRGIAEGAFGGSILSGLQASPGGGMTVDISAGLAVSPSGRLIVVPTTQNATVASPSGNPAKTLIVLRPTSTDTESIPEPVNPSNNVNLHAAHGYQVVVINGTPAASPSYPSTQADDVVLMGLELDASHATIVVGDFDRSPIDLPRRKRVPYRQVLASYTIVEDDEHIDVDAAASGPTILLPSAQSVPGLDFHVMKVDSGSNTVAVSGQGGDLISGQSSYELTDQWMGATFRSTGTAWRVL